MPVSRAPLAEAAGELHARAAVVLRKRWVGEHTVELADLAVVEDERVLQSVTVLDRGSGDVVEDHVHDADRPDRAVGVLAVEGEVVGVLALLFHVLVGLNEEAAGADRRVVDGVAGLRLGELDEQADDLARGIELTALLAGAVGEELDEVLVGGAEQVGELEVVVDEDEPGLAEMVEQVFPLLVWNLRLALHRVEVDVVLQHTDERIVLVFDRSDCLVEHVADVVLEVLQGRDEIAVLVLPGRVPAGSDGDKEGFAVGCLVFEQLGDEIRLVFEVCEGLLAELLASAVELIGEPLQEQHAEDEFLKLRGVHLAAQDVGGLQEEGLELGEGDFLLFHRPPPLTLPSLRFPFAFRTPAGPDPSHIAVLPACQGLPPHHHYPSDQGW